MSPECVYPAIAGVTAEGTNQSEPTSNLLCDAPAFRAINVVAAADGTLVTDDVNDFHRVEAGAACATPIVVQNADHLAVLRWPKVVDSKQVTLVSSVVMPHGAIF